MTLKIWLSLTLTVLLVHLALLQTLPLHLPMAQTEVTSTFATRTVLLASQPPLAPAKNAAVPGKPTRKPAQKTAPLPTLQPVTAPAPSAPADSSASMASADATASAVNPDAAPTTDPMASAAATPASAPAPLEVLATAAAELAQAPEPSAAPTIQQAAFSATGLPGSVKLVYRVQSNKFPYLLRGELLWQQLDQAYQARLSISAFGQSRVQTSRGLVDRHGLAPERFSDKYRSEVAAHFNRERGMATFSANTPNLPLQPGAQDRLSVLVQLAALVASAPQRFTPGTLLSVQTIGPRDGDLWLFTFGDMEALELPGGPQRGLKLVRQPRQAYDQKLEVWLAPGLAYLPARIRITEANGDYVDQKWETSESADSP
ncbi:MAG: DUF3108 domain-containing protein [Betaproteobacteria bacterium HGW-Betaproteobacteria-18]|nr:MAG: DUF3108 domain-containing protein [Betaproteobacteria bacterium HGW-Betaproteobacteria-18]